MPTVTAPPAAAATHRCTVVGAHHGGDDGVSSEVTFEVTFEVTAGCKVLHEMAMRGHRALTVGCRGGGCGACRVRVLGGTYDALRMSARFVTEADRAAGVVLACRIVPTSDLIVEPAPLT